MPGIKNVTPVGEALKRTRLGRLKYSRDWSDPANIKELLNKCSSNTNLGSVLSETDVSICENFNDSRTYSGLSPTSEDGKISDEENFSDVFVKPLIETNSHQSKFRPIRKHSKTTVYEEDLIFWKLRWDQELETVQENRRRLLEDQFDRHMKSFTNRTVSSENKSLSPPVQEESQSIFQPKTVDDQNDSQSSLGAIRPSTEQPSLPSGSPINEFQEEIRSTTSVKLSDDEDEPPPTTVPTATVSQIETIAHQPNVEEILNKTRVDDFVRVSNVIREEIKILDQLLKDNDPSTSSYIKSAPDVRSMVATKLEKLCKQVDQTKICSISTLRTTKELEEFISKLIEQVEQDVSQRLTSSPDVVERKDEIQNAQSFSNEVHEEESIIEIDASPHVVATVSTPAPIPTRQEPASNADALPAALFGTVTADGYALYCFLMEQLDQTQNTLKSFKENESGPLKKYRNQIHKQALSYLNTISTSNLKENLTKLHRFLAGTDDQKLIQKHPKALLFCLDLIAQRLIKQAEINVAESNEPVFNAAAVAVALCCEFEQLRNLILAHLFLRCLYLVPFYRPRLADQTEEQYLKSLGYDTEENVGGRGTFLKRVTGMTKFYLALMITPSPPTIYFAQNNFGAKFSLYPSSSSANQQSIRPPPPFGIRMAWYLLANIGNVKPITQITATVLLEVLQTAGWFLNREYKHQFHRLLAYFKNVYMPMLKNAHKDMIGLAYTELERLFRKPTFDIPANYIGENIWNPPAIRNVWSR